MSSRLQRSAGHAARPNALCARKEAAAGITPAVTLIFAIASGIAVANVYFAQPLLDAIADEFRIGRALSGGIIACTQVGYALGLLLIVPLGDVIERRTLATGQLLLGALTLLLISFSTSAVMLLLSMTAMGGLAVVAQVLVAYGATLAAPAQRGRTVGHITSGIIIGIILARVVAGAIGDQLGWRAVYLISAFATAVVATAVYFQVPKTCTAPQERPSYLPLIWSVFWLLRDEQVLRSRSTIALLIFASVTCFVTPLALHLGASPFSMSRFEVGLFGLSGFAGVVGASFAGRMSDSGRARQATGIAVLSMVIAWCLIGFSPFAIPILVLGAVAMDFGLQAAHVSNQNIIYALRPQARSRLVAAYMCFYSAGCAIGSVGSTIVYDRAGWPGVGVLGSAISIAALALWATKR